VINDYYDTIRGVDTPTSPTALYRPHPLLSGLFSPRQTLAVGLGLFSAGAAAVAAAAALGRLLVLPIFALGALVLFSYTGPLAYLKYRGLAEPMVFVVWGPIFFLGGHYAVSGHLSIRPLEYSVPVGLLVAAVVLANNIRDIDSDARAGVRTVAVRLGKRRAVSLYRSLIVAAYVWSAWLALGDPALALTALAAPLALRLSRWIEDPARTLAEARTAQFALLFAALFAAGTALRVLLP
ncbi:MAG: prenyltransferase, partial [Thermoproteus sp.]